MRPDAQLFLHILGATSLFGSLLTVAVLGLVGRRQAEPASFAGASLLTTLGFAVPAWVLMFAFGSWTKSKEKVPDTVDWVKQPVAIAVVGIFVLVASAGIAYSWKRKPSSTWQPLALGLVALGYTAALGAAWWIMTAKVAF